MQRSSVARAGLEVSIESGPPRVANHWLYMALRRAARGAEAAAVLEPIRDDFDVIENESYYTLVRIYKGGASSTLRSTAPSAPGAQLDQTHRSRTGSQTGTCTTATRRGPKHAFERIRASGQWASFGYIAAEADLARMRAK